MSVRALGFAVCVVFSVSLANAADGHGSKFCQALLSEATAEVELRIMEKGTRKLSPEADRIFALLTIEDADLAPAFERAPPRRKVAMIRRQLARRSTSFREDRRIPNLRLKRRVQVRWPVPTRFLGIEYAADIEHEVDLSPLYGSPGVELGSAAARTTAGFLEIHFRTATLDPGQLERELWTLLDGLGISKDKAHVHVVVPIPRERLASEAERFGLVNGYRYLNMAAEMISILYKGNSIRTDQPSAWGALYGIALAGLVSDLELYAAEGVMPEPDKFKMSYVGFHFPNKYDGQDNFGLQFRSVDRRVSGQMAALLSDGRAFLRRTTWVDPNHRAWMARYRHNDPLAFTMSMLWHREGIHRPDSEGAPAAIRERLMEDEELRDVIEETGVNLYEAQMLTYDWARDPLYFGDEVAIESVRRCQERAFGRFAAAREYRLEFTRDFLHCAGIYERVRRWLRQPPI